MHKLSPLQHQGDEAWGRKSLHGAGCPEPPAPHHIHPEPQKRNFFGYEVFADVMKGQADVILASSGP